MAPHRVNLTSTHKESEDNTMAGVQSRALRVARVLPAQGSTWARPNPDAVEGRTCLAELVRNVGTAALPVLHEFDVLGDGAGSRRRGAVGQWSSAMASLPIFG